MRYIFGQWARPSDLLTHQVSISTIQGLINSISQGSARQQGERKGWDHEGMKEGVESSSRLSCSSRPIFGLKSFNHHFQYFQHTIGAYHRQPHLRLSHHLQVGGSKEHHNPLLVFLSPWNVGRMTDNGKERLVGSRRLRYACFTSHLQRDILCSTATKFSKTPSNALGNT